MDTYDAWFHSLIAMRGSDSDRAKRMWDIENNILPSTLKHMRTSYSDNPGYGYRKWVTNRDIEMGKIEGNDALRKELRDIPTEPKTGWRSGFHF